MYVALAERENCELVTADTRLYNLQPYFPFVTSLASLPCMWEAAQPITAVPPRFWPESTPGNVG